MKDAILGNTVSKSTAHEWLTSMSFIPHPDEETLALVLPLIYHPNAKNESQYWFSVSSLIHTYCKRNSSCFTNENIQKFLFHVQEIVENSCSLGELDRTAQTQVKR